MNELLLNMSFYQELTLFSTITVVGLVFSTFIKKIEFNFLHPLLVYIAFSYGINYFTKEHSSIISIIYNATDNPLGFIIGFTLFILLILKSFSKEEDLSKYVDNNSNTGHTIQSFFMACLVMYTKFLHLSTDPYMIFFSLLFVGFIVFNLGILGEGNTKVGEKS